MSSVGEEAKQLASAIESTAGSGAITNTSSTAGMLGGTSGYQQ